MSVTKATAGALCLSSATLILSLYAIFSIYSDVQSIWSQLDQEMDQFKVTTDDLWTQMLGLGAATVSNRQRRQGKEQYGGYEAQGENYASAPSHNPSNAPGASYSAGTGGYSGGTGHAQNSYGKK
ncbi:hypothetical protein CAEBREN_11119 [Caenorhabditis brenneri]|uniref:Nematode cuticle collagen N-terminal domain-containing protein n=1 Tax=Caenorhabditis brenneri TaxID=135651 RepID=G0PIB8_CAEBE|nr:hypothetical protein CAEBREN_11119 [Caenorhabditis brenneri]